MALFHKTIVAYFRHVLTISPTCVLASPGLWPSLSNSGSSKRNCSKMLGRRISGLLFFPFFHCTPDEGSFTTIMESRSSPVLRLQMKFNLKVSGTSLSCRCVFMYHIIITYVALFLFYHTRHLNCKPWLGKVHYIRSILHWKGRQNLIEFIND